jgi:hypothetical protein
MFFSQKGQDRWLMEEVFASQRGGYFVDLAAAHPKNNSNTFCLEKTFDWTGVCIEANPQFVKLLREHRTATVIDACVDEGSETVDFVLAGQLGGIIADDTDNNAVVRSKQIEKWDNQGLIRSLETRSLCSILDEVQAPTTIQYLSLDVEGAEERILRSFPFDRYKFLAMTVERPTPELNRILLDVNCYTFVKNIFSPQVNEITESFYIHPSIDREDIQKECFEQVPPKRW